MTTLTNATVNCEYLHSAFGGGCPHCMPRPRLLSPCCGEPLELGPVIYWCPGCRRDVHGSTIDREVLSMPAKRITTCGCGSMRSGGSCTRCEGARS